MSQVSAALSCFEETIRENEAAASRSGKNGTKSKSSGERKSTRRTGSSRKLKVSDKTDTEATPKQVETSTARTEELGSSSTIDPAWAVPGDDTSSLGDGSFGMANDFDFDGDEWDAEDDQMSDSKPESKTTKKSEKKKHDKKTEQKTDKKADTKAATKKKKSSTKKKHSEKQDQEEGGFEVTYNGDKNDTTQNRIRKSLMRKEESTRSFNSAMGGGLDAEESVSHATHVSRRSSACGSASPVSEEKWSLWAGGQQNKSQTKQTRRTSLEHVRPRKYGGSAGIQYGTPECEAYLSTLPPAFQLSERRRLQQKQAGASAGNSKSTRSPTRKTSRTKLDVSEK